MGRNVVRSEAWEYAVVDVATDSTTVCSGPATLRAIIVNTALSAHTCPIKDGTTTVFTLPASQAVGFIDLYGIKFRSSLIVDPNDSGTGNITLVWAPN
jgi:hypothetical protein